MNAMLPTVELSSMLDQSQSQSTTWEQGRSIWIGAYNLVGVTGIHYRHVEAHFLHNLSGWFDPSRPRTMYDHAGRLKVTVEKRGENFAHDSQSTA